ncbi:MAG TPA: TolC family protein, partial [Steroidobacteraceae bacterium]|nr:TolC family protein [Steroidobacteraceae bacterium]
LPPAIDLGADLETVLGADEFSGIDSAEFTLSLSSVLERTAKRAGREAVATSSLGSLATERDAKRLDLLAEVARRYLAVIAARQRVSIAADEIALRERVVAAATARISEGASPVSVRQISEAQATRARIDRARAEADLQIAWQDLAVLWGGAGEAAVPELAGNVLALPEVESLRTLLAQLDATPALRRLNDAARLRQAELQLARAESDPDLLWRVGVRRVEADDDWALVAGAAVPFGASRRAEPAIRAARASLDALDTERAGVRLDLESTLIRAHGRYTAARAECTSLSDALLPSLEAAASAAERAYRAGAASYLEWTDVLSEITAVRLARLETAVEAHLALIEIQRLTGDSLVVASEAKETAQ